MILIEQLLETKGKEIWSISPDDTALDAIRLMAEKQVGALPVMDGEKLPEYFQKETMPVGSYWRVIPRTRR